jgi:hypothetical protein
MIKGEKIMDVAKALGVYQELKQKKATLDANYKAAKAPIDEAMTQIEDKLLGHLNETKQDSIKTANGTTFVSELTQVNVKDLEAFSKFLNERPDLADWMQKKVNKATALEYAEANGGTLPPGLDTFIVRKINIRK